MNIRLLRADEIDVRIGGFNKDKTGGFLLLYKDARVDMTLLDETFGVTGWQRRHELINGNLFCTISIWDDDKKQWVDKQDVGVESKSAKEKGEASDAFKRAGTNVGIGRELYTPLFIWINGLAENDKFKVSEIGYNDKREIDKLTIVNNKGIQAFKLGAYTAPDKQKTPTTEQPKGKVINNLTNAARDTFYKHHGDSGDSPEVLDEQPKRSISEKQIARLYTLGNVKNIKKETVDSQIKTRFNKSVKDLDSKEYKIVCDGYENLKVEG